MPVNLRVVSYNIHSQRPARPPSPSQEPQRDHRAALAAVVRSLAPDVLLLQEAPRHFRWRQKCAGLARTFGLLVAVGGLPALGNLILTSPRVRVGQTWCLRYPLTPGRHMRGAALARCSVGGARFLAAGSHLATDPAERPDQAKLLQQALTEVDEPVVVGADLNEQPTGVAWQTLADGLTDPAPTGQPTYPCADPRRRIDAILVDPKIEVRGYEVADTPQARRASDHLPVVADLRL